MKTVQKKLARYIEGTNLVNQYTTYLLAKVLPQLEQYIGKKIFTTKGEKTKNFNIDLDVISLPSKTKQGDEIKVFFNYFGDSNNTLLVKICIHGDYDKNGVSTYCEYFEKYISLGNVKNGVLEQIENFNSLIEDYKLDEVIDLYDEEDKLLQLETLLKEVEQVKSAIKVSPDFYKYF